MYIVTRQDLSPGAQAVQAAHALCEFSIRYNKSFVTWHKESNYLCLLSVDNEEELKQLREAAFADKIQFADFCEPDLDFSLTAVAFEPTVESRRLCRRLKLCLS